MSIPTCILLVDDHGLFRESLVRLLESEPDFRVVSHCATISATMDVLQHNPIDLVLLDYDLGEERGVDLLQQLHACKGSARVLMVTAGMSDRITLDVINAGIAGIIYKHSSPTQLVEAIRKISRGEMWFDSSIVSSLLVAKVKNQEVETRNTRPLTSRQQDVLSSILNGLTNKEIAWNLKASESSVKAVIQELFHKAGVRTRSQLVRIAIEKHATDWLGNDNK
ncbi:response regulator [Edaphobacter dinghuensis]|nr:response regulator transcription factor [Edaphobacter dinghuensis]